MLKDTSPPSRTAVREPTIPGMISMPPQDDAAQVLADLIEPSAKAGRGDAAAGRDGGGGGTDELVEE